VDVRYYIDTETELPHICWHAVVERIAHGPARAEDFESASVPTQEETMTQSKFPAGWDDELVRRALEHYETQSDEEAVAEDEAAYVATTHTAMEVPVELVPVVRELIAKRRPR
jgi:hypothetical protein